jgi:transcriptional regulator with XRE-family HTH domain
MVKTPRRKSAPKKKKMNYHNADPAADPPPGAPREVILRDFGRRLQSAIADKGWNQSELARRAAIHMPDGKFGRDNVSNYVRGSVLPGPAHLEAMAKALGVKQTDILPSRGVPSVDANLPEFEMRNAGAGKAWLRINQQVDFDVALQIAGLLRGQGDD